LCSIHLAALLRAAGAGLQLVYDGVVSASKRMACQSDARKRRRKLQKAERSDVGRSLLRCQEVIERDEDLVFRLFK
jgi:hypothetical protein